jgi:hypothetical protein
MTCKEFASSVTDYLEAALPSRHRAEFDEHLASCRNCRTYFEQMNQLIRAAPTLREDPGATTVPSRLYELLAEKTGPRSAERWPIEPWYKPALIAVAVVIILAGLWVYRIRYSARPRPLAATIDLTQWLHLRGMAQPPQPPIQLPRAKLDLTVDLPIAAEPGEYQVGIASNKSDPFLITAGTATLVDHIAHLRVKLDLTRVAPGSYRFGVRPEASDWTYFPLRIK